MEHIQSQTRKLVDSHTTPNLTPHATKPAESERISRWRENVEVKVFAIFEYFHTMFDI